jgi:hypothetical protein
MLVTLLEELVEVDATKVLLEDKDKFSPSHHPLPPALANLVLEWVLPSQEFNLPVLTVM